ncbi:MAG: sensor histidine kinase [Bacteroidota bacterium]
MRAPIVPWTKQSLPLFGVISLILLGYWLYCWQVGLVPYAADGSADLGGFIRWLLGYVFLLTLILGAAWLNHRLLFRRMVSRQSGPPWTYYSWLLIFWWVLFEGFQFLNAYAAEVVIENWFVSLLCMLLIAIITLAIDQPEVRRKRAELEQDKTEAELHNLKAQLHPHFLFNTLNTIYSEALERDQEELATLIAELSGLLRYSFTHAKQALVSLQEEGDFLGRYIHLQKARLSPTQQAAVQVSLLDNFPSLGLPPLLLIPFVENAFVHGVHDGPGFFIKISMAVEDEYLCLRVENSKPTRPRPDGNGTGISNTRQRLDRLYQHRYELAEQQSVDTYSLFVKFPLTPFP